MAGAAAVVGPGGCRRRMRTWLPVAGTGVAGPQPALTTGLLLAGLKVAQGRPLEPEWAQPLSLREAAVGAVAMGAKAVAAMAMAAVVWVGAEQGWAAVAAAVVVVAVMAWWGAGVEAGKKVVAAWVAVAMGGPGGRRTRHWPA